jgi:hypothetical protein
MLLPTMESAQPDARELLDATLPHLLPERVVEVASARAGCPTMSALSTAERCTNPDMDGALRVWGDVIGYQQIDGVLSFGRAVRSIGVRTVSTA